MKGDKSSHKQDCEKKTKLGYICASMNYNYLTLDRKPEYSIYRILDEITSLLETIKQFLGIQGFDVDKLEICMAGGSAGAHLSLLYSYWLGDKSPIPIKFVYNTVAPVTLEFDYWWRYKDEPLDSIEPDDIKNAEDHNLIESNYYTMYDKIYINEL